MTNYSTLTIYELSLNNDSRSVFIILIYLRCMKISKRNDNATLKFIILRVFFSIQFFSLPHFI